MATENVIVPNAVGVDIGCGMCAVKTSLADISTQKLKEILGNLRKLVPLGFEHHRTKQNKGYLPKLKKDLPIVNREYESALKQVGTLGGGNHFIEFQKGSDGHIWIMVHSGSRNLGFKVASHYNRMAKGLDEGPYTSLALAKDLAYLKIDTEEAEMYLNEMEYCVKFALANRKLIMDRVCETVKNTLLNVQFDPMINIAHNYVACEKHFGKDVWVHRKGATSAKKGEIGIVPGSQGVKSYIVKGLGNPESFMSCSHGVGRKMGRKQAQRILSFQEEKKNLEEQGILHSLRSKRDLDEAAGAYKDVATVMKNQKDLAEALVELQPLAVIKG